MNVWCREHAQRLGFVRLHGDTWPEFVTLSPRWKARHAEEAWAKGAISAGERANSFTKLSISTDVTARGCSECGSRMLDVATILAAFEEGRDKISL